METTTNKSNILKTLGAIGVLVPLLGAIVTATVQYYQFVEESRANNFRTVVEKMASEIPEERLAAATNLGVYIQDEKYAKQALDILINMSAIELNANVLSAIRSSLGEVKNEDDRQKVIQKLLNVEQSTFAYETAIRDWTTTAKTETDTSYNQFYKDLTTLKEKAGIQPSEQLIAALAKVNSLEDKAKIRHLAEKQYSEIGVRQRIIASFIKSYLNNTINAPVKNLEFFQNSLDRQSIVNVELIDPRIINSAFSSMKMDKVRIVGKDGCKQRQDGSLECSCTIENTTFSYSIITNSLFRNCNITQSLFTGEANENGTFQLALRNISFSGSVFGDVYFYMADLDGANFTDTQGLKPEYFFGSINYHKAKFDNPEFIQAIDVVNNDVQHFLNFIADAKLYTRYIDLCDNLWKTEQLLCHNYTPPVPPPSLPPPENMPEPPSNIL